MTKYREKRKIINAFQMTLERRWDNSEWPYWLHVAWNTEPGKGAVWISSKAPIAPGNKSANELLCGRVTEAYPIGTWRIAMGDWIILDESGEIYPCSPDDFAAAYELDEEVGECL